MQVKSRVAGWTSLVKSAPSRIITMMMIAMVMIEMVMIAMVMIAMVMIAMMMTAIMMMMTMLLMMMMMLKPRSNICQFHGRLNIRFTPLSLLIWLRSSSPIIA